ncbi:hypothetical protein [Mongoliitalea daihaiensis]|uniref:hypothetical protein n=1 Tax=Mongoliitalea daihaiensis TaxID=2782006 RepID=UPI001F182A8D|nr:hypothetical protein [Mongoliitalea daihaiensis]UJP63551.1 hypothetical protein IPZ59_11940 [Mongoliitalea daihaiensis]
MHKSFVPLAVAFIILLGCSQKGEQKVLSTKYPNEDAPLALLMRSMFEDMEEIKHAVEKGEAIKGYVAQHQELLTARPTNPAVKTATFELMGKAYLESLKYMENSSQEELISNYKMLVETCLACHQQYCPGPIKRINLLNLPL